MSVNCTGVHQGSEDRTAVYIVYKRPTRLVKSASTSIFADDTNLSSKANTREDTDILQNDGAALDKWSKVWEPRFVRFASKCHILHFGGKKKKAEMPPM